MKIFNTLGELFGKPLKPSERLKNLLSGEKWVYPGGIHKYKQETSCGIGFCEICHSDDENDGNHIISDK